MDLWRIPVVRVVPSFGRDVKPVVPLVLFDRSRLRAGSGFLLLPSIVSVRVAIRPAYGGTVPLFTQKSLVPRSETNVPLDRNFLLKNREIEHCIFAPHT